MKPQKPAWLAGLLCVACAGAPATAPPEVAAVRPARAAAAPPAGPEPWLEVATPAPFATLRGVVPWVEIRGRAGLGQIHHYDVILAIDLSTSTLHPTGLDVDGDGVVGELTTMRPRADWSKVRLLTTDWDDTIVSAEIRAAETLLARLDPDTTRVGLVSFATRPRERAPVGAPEKARAKLDRLRDPSRSDATALAEGIEQALRSLSEAPPVGDAAREPIVVLLSDGVPTHPEPVEAARLALEAAEAAARSGVRIHAVALGNEAMRQTDVYERIAAATGGLYVAVESPGKLPRILPHLSLTGLEEVRIRNETTDSPAEAIRVLPDGGFDAYVRLSPGWNVLEITAELAGGGQARDTRSLFYVQPDAPSPSDLEAAAALREKVRLRTIEMGLAAEARAYRARPRRVLTVTSE